MDPIRFRWLKITDGGDPARGVSPIVLVLGLVCESLGGLPFCILLTSSEESALDCNPLGRILGLACALLFGDKPGGVPTNVSSRLDCVTISSSGIESGVTGLIETPRLTKEPLRMRDHALSAASVRVGETADVVMSFGRRLGERGCA